MAITSKKIELIVASIAAVGTLFAIIAIRSNRKEESYINEATSRVIALNIKVAARTAIKPQIANMAWHTATIKAGDTLKSIFVELRIPENDLWLLLKLKNPKLALINPGQKIHLLLGKDRHLNKLRITVAPDKLLEFSLKKNKYTQEIIQLPVTERLSFNTGTISTTLSQSAIDAGLSHKRYQQLLKVFRGQINFNRDINRGDRFSILYKQYYVNGEPTHSGDIEAAEFQTRHHTYHAIRFQYPNHTYGYYSLNGKSIEHRFMAFPLKYRRISSHFSRDRMDPILHKRRPHLGIDFAANRGTPIHSIGNGRITFIGKDHGYGNAIKIRYDKHYSALYAHMKRFAKNLKIHQYIHKGQVIGYVGSTGWSTGPHLHFGFYAKGIPQDWLAIHPPTNTPIPRKFHKQFSHDTQTYLAALKLHQSTELAANTMETLK